MGEILRFKKPKPADKHRGKTLCRHGFHKWVVWKEKQFDVQRGRLVTVYRCARCAAEKAQAL